MAKEFKDDEELDESISLEVVRKELEKLSGEKYVLFCKTRGNRLQC